MKHSNKSHDSFQDELENYIKVQKARGLEPETSFRRMREDCLRNGEYREEVDSRPRYRMFGPRFASGTIHTYPGSCTISPTVENRLPARDSKLRLDSLSSCQFSRDSFSEKPGPLNRSQQEYNGGSYNIEVGVHQHLCSGHSARDSHTGREQMHQKRKRPLEETEKGWSKHERKGSSEDVDFDKHKSIQRKRAKGEADAELVSAEKPRNRKEKKSRDEASKREDRKHRRERKEQGQERTEEEMLWDQSILGF